MTTAKTRSSVSSRKPYTIQAKGKDVGEVYIYEGIGDSWDGTTAKSFAADLKALADARRLDIFINSDGGSVFDGVAIFNQLRRHRAEKQVFIDGIAASIASVIAMAGDKITMGSNTYMMVHNPWVMAIGDDAELRKIADALEKVRGTIIDTYAERTGQAPNVVADLMNEETWMTAQEALDLGFADEIGADAEMAARFDLSRFSNVPEDLAAKIDLARNPPKLKLVSNASTKDAPVQSEAEEVETDPPAEEDPPCDAAPLPADHDLDFRKRLQKARHRHRQAGLLEGPPEPPAAA